MRLRRLCTEAHSTLQSESAGFHVGLQLLTEQAVSSASSQLNKLAKAKPPDTRKRSLQLLQALSTRVRMLSEVVCCALTLLFTVSSKRLSFVRLTTGDEQT
jgi:hypothetical protein